MIDELDKMNDIFKYIATEGAIVGDLFTKSGKDIYFWVRLFSKMFLQTAK